MHHHYILCILPDKNARPVRISSDYCVDLERFLERKKISSYNLYYVSPSWIQVLPEKGIWTIPNELENDFREYRLQYLHESSPKFILRLIIKSNFDINLANWCICLEEDSDLSLNSIISIFNNCFCVNVEDFSFEFENNDGLKLDYDIPLMDQKNVLKNTKVILKVKLSQETASKTKQKREIMKEIITSEEYYVNALKTVSLRITKELFSEFNFNADVFNRIFKSIAEIIPTHEKFLNALKLAGTDPETPIGYVFRQWIPLFKMSSSHISNYKTANEELQKLLRMNPAFRERIAQITKEFFDDTPLDNLFVKPIQRIPQYPIFLERIKKATSPNHWDFHDIECAISGINKLLNDLDSQKKIQDDLDVIANLQEKFGGVYNVIKTSRKLLFQIENVPLNSKSLCSIYLFSDIILVENNKKFKEFDIVETSIRMQNGNAILNNQYSFPYNDQIAQFISKFNLSKREKIKRMNSFGQALFWIHSPSDNGPPSLISSSLISINKILYLFGGMNQNTNEYNEDLWVYSMGVWTNKQTKNHPEARFMHTLCAYNNKKLILFGGKNSTQCFNDVYIYNIEKGSWKMIETLHSPSPRYGHCSIVIGSKMFVIGGKNDNNAFFDDIFIFDIKLKEWKNVKYSISGEKLPPMAFFSALLLKTGNILITGGLIDISNTLQNNETLKLWILNPDDLSCTLLNTTGQIPSSRYGYGAGVFRNSLYLLGGSNSLLKKSNSNENENSVLNDCYIINLNTDSDGKLSWCQLPYCEMPSEGFVFGSCSSVENFGLALFSKCLFKIKLSFDRQTVSLKNRQSMLLSKKYNTAMSIPIYNPKEKIVITVADKIVVQDIEPLMKFSLLFNENSLREIFKCSSNNETFWRLTYVLEHDGSSAIDDSCNRFVLSEDLFIGENDPNKEYLLDCAERKVELYNSGEFKPLHDQKSKRIRRRGISLNKIEKSPNYSLSKSNKNIRKIYKTKNSLKISRETPNYRQAANSLKEIEIKMLEPLISNLSPVKKRSPSLVETKIVDLLDLDEIEDNKSKIAKSEGKSKARTTKNRLKVKNSNKAKKSKVEYRHKSVGKFSIDALKHSKSKRNQSTKSNNSNNGKHHDQPEFLCVKKAQYHDNINVHNQNEPQSINVGIYSKAQSSPTIYKEDVLISFKPDDSPQNPSISTKKSNDSNIDSLSIFEVPIVRLENNFAGTSNHIDDDLIKF